MSQESSSPDSNSILSEITPRSSGESSIWAISRRCGHPCGYPAEGRLLCRVLFQLCSQQKKHDNMRFTELLNIRYCQNLSDTWNVRSFARSTTASQKIRPSCCLIRGAQLQDRPPAKCTDRFAEKLRDFKKNCWVMFIRQAETRTFSNVIPNKPVLDRFKRMPWNVHIISMWWCRGLWCMMYPLWDYQTWPPFSR